MKQIATFLLGLLWCMGAMTQELTVGSYNIRNNNNTDSIIGNGWRKRCKPMCDQIHWERPDVFGTQEVLHPQLMDLAKGLPDYQWIGVGRDDGKQDGEYAAIFYNPSRVKLVEQGNFWLSETPDRPSLGWDAACIRICTWGHFKDLQTKKDFYFLNLHMDHVGVKARSEAAKLVMQRITEMTDSGKKSRSLACSRTATPTPSSVLPRMAPTTASITIFTPPSASTTSSSRPVRRWRALPCSPMVAGRRT